MARSLVSPTTTTSATGSHRLEGTPEMTSDVQVLVRRGPDIAEWFDAVAGLRASVFRSFPYLYEGDTEYEKHYLAIYARSADSLLVLALADDVVGGASKGLPPRVVAPAFHAIGRAPFRDR